MSHLKDRGIGVLITDHNVRETLEIIDRAYIMHDGQVLMEGRPQEVVAHEDVRRVYLGESSACKQAMILRASCQPEMPVEPAMTVTRLLDRHARDRRIARARSTAP